MAHFFLARPQNGDGHVVSHCSQLAATSVQRLSTQWCCLSVTNQPGNENAKSRPAIMDSEQLHRSISLLIVCCRSRPLSKHTGSSSSNSAQNIFWAAFFFAPDQSTAITRVGMESRKGGSTVPTAQGIVKGVIPATGSGGLLSVVPPDLRAVG